MKAEVSFVTDQSQPVKSYKNMWMKNTRDFPKWTQAMLERQHSFLYIIHHHRNMTTQVKQLFNKKKRVKPRHRMYKFWRSEV